MEIGPNVPNAAAGAIGSANPLAQGSQALGKDEFLQLLVTQLSNQDPLNPMEGQEFAAQLAQFSSVEALLNIQNTLTASVEMNGLLAQSMNSGLAADMIGKTVEAQGNTVTWDGSDDITLGFELASAASDVKVTILDENGQVVRTIDVGASERGDNTLTWNGEDDNGARVGTGQYTFNIEATGANDSPVSANPFVTGHVDRITFTADGILLWLGDTSIAIGNVRSVRAG